ncbi:MAG: DNA-directed RNA polymerase subunit delta [Bacilli bacterium]
MSQAHLKEMSMIELTKHILNETKQPHSFQELLKQVSTTLEISEAVVEERIGQFYTDLNIDGGFIMLAGEQVGLREWYPFEQYEDETLTSSTKVKKKRGKKVEVEEFEDFDDAEEVFVEELGFEDESDDDDDEEEEVVFVADTFDEVDEDEDDDDDTYVETDDFDDVISDEEFELEDDLDEVVDEVDEGEEEEK